MSSSKFDKHFICFACRPTKCDLSNRSAECADWSPSEIEDYVNHRCSLESKSKRDSSMPRVSPALVIATQDSEPRSDIDLQDAGGC